MTINIRRRRGKKNSVKRRYWLDDREWILKEGVCPVKGSFTMRSMLYKKDEKEDERRQKKSMKFEWQRLD